MNWIEKFLLWWYINFAMRLLATAIILGIDTCWQAITLVIVDIKAIDKIKSYIINMTKKGGDNK